VRATPLWFGQGKQPVYLTGKRTRREPIANLGGVLPLVGAYDRANPLAAVKKPRAQKRNSLVAAQNPASAERRLRQIIEEVLERVRDAPEDNELSSNEIEEVVTATDVSKIVADVLMMKADESCKHVNTDACTDEDGDAGVTIWGISVDDWHTLLLVLDGYVKSGATRLGEESGGDSTGYTDAALIILHIATLNDRPTKLLISETIDTILSMMKRVLNCVILPGKMDKLAKDSDSKSTPYVAAKVKKAASKAASGASAVVNHLGELCRRETLEDSMLISLSALGITTMGIDGPTDIASLQMGGIQLLCTIAQHHRDHRKLLFSELFNALTKVSFSSSKKQSKQYQVANGVAIQMMSACFFKLLHASVVSREAFHLSCARTSLS
jgi:hypothetical protein